jgi:hypothetical protein
MTGAVKKIRGRVISRAIRTGNQNASRKLLRAEWREELRQREIERTDEPTERSDADVAFAAFNAANVISMEIGTFREGLLRNVSFLPEPTDTFANGCWQVAPHTGMVNSCTRKVYTR